MKILCLLYGCAFLVIGKFFEKLITYSSQYDFGIAGVAGVSAEQKIVYSSVTMDIDHRQAGVKNVEVKAVDTLDECLFIREKDFGEYIR